MATPVFLVTEYKNVRRKSPANVYTGGGETIDLWKVGLIHGYYAGMGMNFYFPTEPEASRFTLYTIYRPEEIIERMDNEKFVAEKVQRWKYMSPANRYTDTRTLKDNWKISFSGERNDFLELIHPWESETRKYKLGNPYTVQDILGIMPATPRETVAILEAYAEQLRRLAEERELERIRREIAAEVPSGLFPFEPLRTRTFESVLADQPYFAEQRAWMQLSQDERTAILRAQYIAEREAYLSTFTSERTRYLADTYSIHQGNPDIMLQLWASYQQQHYQEAQFDADVREYLISQGYVFAAPPPDGGGSGTVEQQKANAIAHWHAFTPNATASAWIAGAQLSAEGQSWTTAGPGATNYRHVGSSGDPTLAGLSTIRSWFLDPWVNVRNVVSDREFEWLCFVVFG